MAISNVRDAYKIIQTAGDTYVGDDSDQTYSINPNLIGAGEVISIVGTGGSNTIELRAGLTISLSIVTANETQFTLSNGAIINIRGADAFSFNTSGSLADGKAGVNQTYEEFVTDTLGSYIPAQGETPAFNDGERTINEDGTIAGSGYVALVEDTVGVDGVVENFFYEIDSSTGAVTSVLAEDITLSGFTVGEDSLTFTDVANGTVTTETFVDEVIVSTSTIYNQTDVIFDEDTAGNAYQLIITGIVDNDLSTIDMTVV